MFYLCSLLFASGLRISCLPTAPGSRHCGAMISVIIPTFNAAQDLPATLCTLVPAAADGLVREVIVSDGGSQDDTLAIADAMGCGIVHSNKGRGTQLAAGAAQARGPWLLFLHADTLPGPGWEQEVSAFIERADKQDDDRAACFTFALDSFGVKARLLEGMVALRCLVFALPYGDQGLLMRLGHYRRLGGFRHIPLMEDVDIVRRIGYRNLQILRTRAITSARRYETDGYVGRSLRNLSCLALYLLGASPEALMRRYQGQK